MLFRSPRQYELLLNLAKQYRLETYAGEADSIVLKPVAKVTADSVDLKRLTKNEASRLIDKLLSTFGRSNLSSSN